MSRLPTAGLAAALAIPLGLVPAVGAQTAPPVQHIRIQEEGGQCVYRLADQQDQDEFTIQPDGRVVFQFLRGLKATALITQAPDGAPGARGANVIVIGQGGPRSLDVRRAIGRDTEHQVRIQCCMERRGNDCSRWRDAVAAEMGIGFRTGAHGEPSRSGPAAPEADPTTDVEPTTGGPKMKVQE